MAIVSADTNLWEALAGRAPGRPTGPDDPDLWTAVVERLNPVRARPVLRPAIEQAHLTSLRGQPYVMLRSPDEAASYVRLSPEEVELAARMDGSLTVARLVREFVGISGRLAPDQVTRVVADLAANRMLTELPVDAFRRVESVRRRSFTARIGHSLLAAAKGRRIVLASFDRPAGWLYRFGGRLLFTRPAAVLIGLLTLTGLILFGRTWLGGAERLFLSGGSYATGGLVLLGLNVVALLAHELGHALGVKHAGRRVPAIGFLFYFGIPSAFVDTTDVWMAGRRARLITTAAGPLSSLTLAGVVQVIGMAVPGMGPLAFRLAFAWYLNALFNLNPLMALDGYYLAMDWLEIPNLRRRGMAFLVRVVKTRRIGWSLLDREGRHVAMYGVASALWLIIFISFSVRMWRDRVTGLITGLWHFGWVSRLLLVAFVAGLAAPLLTALIGWGGRRIAAWRRRRAERSRTADQPARLAALQSSHLAQLPPEALAALAREARWLRPTTGAEIVAADAALSDVLVVTEGMLEARRPGDPPATVRRRAQPGQIVGLTPALAGVPSSLAWSSAGTRLLTIPAASFVRIVGPLVGRPPVDRAEAEAVVSAAPALSVLPDEEIEGLLRRMQPLDVPPGKSITLEDPDHGAVVESGALLDGDGHEYRCGDLLTAVDEHRLRATARTPVRLWVLPRLSNLTLFGGAASPSSANRSPVAGAHGDEIYAPLLAPPAPPVPPTDDDPDERLAGWFRRILILLLLLAILAVITAATPAIGWVEIADGHAVVSVRRGPVDIAAGGEVRRFGTGDKLTASEADLLTLGQRSTVELIFPGGAAQVLCPNTRVELGAIGRDTVSGDDPLDAARVRPRAAMRLDRGRILADTTVEGADFLPLAFEIEVSEHLVATQDESRFVVSPLAVVVDLGKVTVDGVPLTPAGHTANCSGGLAASAARGFGAAEGAESSSGSNGVPDGEPESAPGSAVGPPPVNPPPPLPAPVAPRPVAPRPAPPAPLASDPSPADSPASDPPDRRVPDPPPPESPPPGSRVTDPQPADPEPQPESPPPGGRVPDPPPPDPQLPGRRVTDPPPPDPEPQPESPPPGSRVPDPQPPPPKLDLRSR